MEAHVFFVFNRNDWPFYPPPPGLLFQAAKALSDAVVTTAKEMEEKPPGKADFFESLKSHICSLPCHKSGKFHFKEGTNAYEAATRR